VKMKLIMVHGTMVAHDDDDDDDGDGGAALNRDDP